MHYIKQVRPCLTTFPNTEKGIENTTRGGVFLRTSRCLEMRLDTAFSVSYIFSIETKTKEKTEK